MAASLQGKVAIVTGGSRGIGRAIASALLAQGVDVTITGVNPSHLREAERQLTSTASGAKLHAIAADVRDDKAVESLFAEATRRFGGLDVLVNNAGVGTFSAVADQSPDEWRRMIDTNLTGVFYCCHAAIPHFRRRGGGWIVNISSLSGSNPFKGGAGYCATKAGLNAFSEALMQELRYDGIRVSYVMPGSVATDFSANRDAQADDWKLRPDDVARVVVDVLSHDPRSLPSRVEIRPSKPRK